MKTQPNPDVPREFVSTAEASRLLGVGVKVLEGWRKLGTGPTYVKHGGGRGSSVSYDSTELAVHIARSRRTSTRDEPREPRQDDIDREHAALLSQIQNLRRQAS